MTSSTLALKRPLAWRATADLLARLWRRATRRRPPAPAPLGELDSHLLRDIQALGRVHGQTLEYSELTRYDRQQARRTTHLKI
ncbi:MAG: hypothetical protein H7172_09270 [Ferruginibacter sp.]|nr:hypothetical protein [Rhodoferax sp.]